MTMTAKQDEEVFRGIHYIRIGGLPGDQQELFTEWLPSDQVIKIMIKKDIMEDCVQYHHYEHWFDNIYPTQEKVKMEVSKEQPQKTSIFKSIFS
jgi:hypothetical protein